MAQIAQGAIAAPKCSGSRIEDFDEPKRRLGKLFPAQPRRALLSRLPMGLEQLGPLRVGPPLIWEKPLSGGAKAVVTFNYVTDDEAEPLTLSFKDVGLTGPVHARFVGAQGARNSSRLLHRHFATGRSGDVAPLEVKVVFGSPGRNS